MSQMNCLPGPCHFITHSSSQAPTWPWGQLHTYGSYSPAWLQTTVPSKHFFLDASLRPVRMLWQTWHRELGGGEQLGSGGGIWTRRSCGRGSPSGDRSRPWAAAAGMARAGSAWLLLLLLAIWVRLWHRGPGRGQHVRPACVSARPPAGPSWTRGEVPPAPGVEACVPGRRGRVAAGEAAGLPPACPPLRALGATGGWREPEGAGRPLAGC